MTACVGVDDGGMARSKQAAPPRRPRRNFIREWRKSRGYTLEKLAELSGVSIAQISNIESRKNGYSWESLEALAEALTCEPADLLAGPPSNDDTLNSLWRRLDPQERARWLRALKAYSDE